MLLFHHSTEGHIDHWLYSTPSLARVRTEDSRLGGFKSLSGNPLCLESDSLRPASQRRKVPGSNLKTAWKCAEHYGCQRCFYCRCSSQRTDRQHGDPVAALWCICGNAGPITGPDEIENALMEEQLTTILRSAPVWR